MLIEHLIFITPEPFGRNKIHSQSRTAVLISSQMFTREEKGNSSGFRDTSTADHCQGAREAKGNASAETTAQARVLLNRHCRTGWARKEDVSVFGMFIPVWSEISTAAHGEQLAEPLAV